MDYKVHARFFNGKGERLKQLGKELIKALELGKDFPPEYLEMKYRERFGLSIIEYGKQPYSRVLEDMKMMEIETTYIRENSKHGQ